VDERDRLNDLDSREARLYVWRRPVRGDPSEEIIWLAQAHHCSAAAHTDVVALGDLDQQAGAIRRKDKGR
jgi:hypothetical protein